MKKMYVFLSILTLVLTPLAAQRTDRPGGSSATTTTRDTPAPSVQTQTENGFQYIQSGNGAGITGINIAGVPRTAFIADPTNIYGRILVIPDTLGGLPVTGIEPRAFFNQLQISGVIIPLSVVTIGAEAFAKTGMTVSSNIIVNSAVSIADTALNEGISVIKWQDIEAYFPDTSVKEVYSRTINSADTWKRVCDLIRQGSFKAYHLVIDGDIGIQPEIPRGSSRQRPTFNYIAEERELNSTFLSITYYYGTRRAVIALTGRGRLYLTDKGYLIGLQGETLIIDGDITLQGIRENNNPLIVVGEGRDYDIRDNVSGKLELRKGTITGNINRGDGGGYDISLGGGVIVGNLCTFEMSGGTISGNTAPGGGGVYLGKSDASFIMTGGTISGNTASGVGGGGVYAYMADAFTMTGGTISGNTARRGAGVLFYWWQRRININGGLIYGNNAAAADRNTASDGSTMGYSVLYDITEDGKGSAFYRDTTINRTDRLTAESLITESFFQGMPAAKGQTLNGWTRKQ